MQASFSSSSSTRSKRHRSTATCISKSSFSSSLPSMRRRSLPFGGDSPQRLPAWTPSQIDPGVPASSSAICAEDGDFIWDPAIRSSPSCRAEQSPARKRSLFSIGGGRNGFLAGACGGSSGVAISTRKKKEDTSMNRRLLPRRHGGDSSTVRKHSLAAPPPPFPPPHRRLFAAKDDDGTSFSSFLSDLQSLEEDADHEISAGVRNTIPTAKSDRRPCFESDFFFSILFQTPFQDPEPPDPHYT